MNTPLKTIIWETQENSVDKKQKKFTWGKLIKKVYGVNTFICPRWDASIEEWKKQVEWVRKFARECSAYVIKH